MTKKPKNTKNIVSNTALYYVCYRLSDRGWNVLPTTKNTAGIDAVCINHDGTLKVTIQVKGLSAQPATTASVSPTVPLGTDLAKIMGDFWVIVNSLSTGQPRTYILDPREVRYLAVRDKGKQQAYWLPQDRYGVHEHEEQWHRIGDPFA